MAIDWKRVGADVVTGGLAENYYTGRQLTGNNGTAPAITAPNQPNIPTPAPPGWIYDSNGNLVQGYLDTHGNLIHGVNPANQSPAIPTPGPAPALDLSKSLVVKHSTELNRLLTNMNPRQVVAYLPRHYKHWLNLNLKPQRIVRHRISN